VKTAYCEKCGAGTPEGFSLCPPCMQGAGAGENEVTAAAELMDIVNILNIADTDASQRAAIESILNIKNRLEEADRAKKEKETQIQTEKTRDATTARPGQCPKTAH